MAPKLYLVLVEHFHSLGPLEPLMQEGMTPAEAVWSATAGGAAALRRDDIGSLRVGARADLAVVDAPSHLHLAYRPGVPLVRTLDLP